MTDDKEKINKYIRYVCDEPGCEKSYKTIQGLNKHLKTHNRVKKLTYEQQRFKDDSDEIEKIANYLIVEKKYDTTIKLNPTLLGSLLTSLDWRLGYLGR